MGIRTSIPCMVTLMLLMFGAAYTQDLDNTTTVDPSAYLMQYGYSEKQISGGQPVQMGEVSALKENTPKMREAIRAFQYMANLPPTGELTAETQAYMVKPRCGVPDYLPKSMTHMRRKRYTSLSSVWPLSQLRSLTYRVGDVPARLNLNKADVDEEVRKAIKVWEKVIPTRITQVTSNQGKADIEMTFHSRDHGDGYPFDGPGGTLAHAFAPNDGMGGDVHFDSDENWRIKPSDQSSGKDVFSMALHELGHSLGLGHTNVPNSIMQPFYNPYLMDLGEDDIAGVQKLYGTIRRAPAAPAPPSNTRRPDVITTTTTPSTPLSTLDPGNNPFQPDYCIGNLRFDAIVKDALDRTFAFFGWSVYELTSRGVVAEYPKRIDEVFEGHKYGVDAALYQKDKIYLFKDNFVLTYNARTMKLVNPSRQFELIGNVFSGLPSNLSAIFTWRKNGRIYAFKGDQYYRLNPETKIVDANYPQSFSKWRTEFKAVDSVFVWPYNQRTYFFSGDRYIRYDDETISTDQTKPYPRMIKTWWLGCQESTQGLNSNPHRPQDMESNDHDRKDVQRAVGDGLTNREPSVPREEAVVNRNSGTFSAGIIMLSLGGAITLILVFFLIGCLCGRRQKGRNPTLDVNHPQNRMIILRGSPYGPQSPI